VGRYDRPRHDSRRGAQIERARRNSLKRKKFGAGSGRPRKYPLEVVVAAQAPELAPALRRDPPAPSTGGKPTRGGAVPALRLGTRIQRARLLRVPNHAGSWRRLLDPFLAQRKTIGKMRRCDARGHRGASGAAVDQSSRPVVPRDPCHASCGSIARGDRSSAPGRSNVERRRRSLTCARR
jgi:hypothetical protein